MSNAFTAVAFPELKPVVAPEITAAGRAAGYAAGRRAAEQELAELRAAAEREIAVQVESGRSLVERALILLSAASDHYARHALPLVEELDTSLLAAAVQIAEAVLQRELSDETRAALSAVHRATALTDPEEVRRLRMHPEDIELVRAFGELPVTAVPDPTLERGDAIADLDRGSLDARISATMARVRGALVGDDA